MQPYDHGSIQSLRHQFRIRSERYKESTAWARDTRIDDLIVSCLPRLSRDQVGLDVGAGTGRLTMRLADMGEKWISMDVSREMLQAGPAPIPVVADANRIPVGDESVDIALAQSILPFVPFGSLLREAHRILRPEGAVVVADKVLGFLRGPDERWYHDLERARNPARRLGRRTEDLAHEAEEAGFRCDFQDDYAIEYQETVTDWLDRAGRMPGSNIEAIKRLLENRPDSVRVFDADGGQSIAYVLTWGLLRLRKA